MHNVNEFDIVKKPLLSEKANAMKKDDKYVFKVSQRTNKLQVKKAVQQIFKVEVKSVNILNYPRKEKLFHNIKGFRAGFKKAVVTTAKNNRIDFERGI